MDERYSYSSNKSQISKWLRDSIYIPDRYEQFDLKLRAFYQKMKSKGFVPKVKMLEDVKIEFDDSTTKSKSKLP